MRKVTTLLCLIVLLGTSYAQQRDPYKWPFSKTSIWNMPIHKNAVYVAAGLPAVPGGDNSSRMPQVDPEIIIIRPTAPLCNINYSDAGWSGKNRCAATGGLLVKAPIPSNYVLPNTNENASAAIIGTDGRTVIQMQPLTRCTAGGDATAIDLRPNQDIYGPGTTGSHGGSGLSTLGGSLRIGELRPGQQGPRHVIKINVYAKQALYKATKYADGYRWPATHADGYTVGWYGVEGNNQNFAMRMGALLAIHKDQDLSQLGLETEPAKQLAWTLQNYGAYIVDDTYVPSFALNAENGVDGSLATQFRNDWGFNLAQNLSNNTPWVRDIQRLMVKLYVINNNDANNIGGGPTTDTINRRAPMACEFSALGTGLMCPAGPPPAPNATFCSPAQSPQIDGTAENTWTPVKADSLKKTIMGNITATDLSSNYKAMWDNTALYLLVSVKDDVLKNESGTSTWDDDAVEIFIDGNNEKANSYDANDRHYILRWNDPAVYSYTSTGAQPVNPAGVTFTQGNNSGGYLMEIKILWSAIGVTPSNGKLIGFDVHLNDDDDGTARDAKIAWIATTDASASNPSSFGTIKLNTNSCGITTDIADIEKSNETVIYPNPFNENCILKISSAIALNNAVIKMYDLFGREMRSISITGYETLIPKNELKNGIYFYEIINDEKSIGKGKLLVQ